MKSVATKFWITLFFLFGANVVPAQTDTVSLTSGGAPFVSGHLPTTPSSTQSPIGKPVNAHLNFGDVAAGLPGRRVTIRIPIRISATTNYKVEIKRSNVNGEGINLTDIGFGVGNARPQTGANPKLSAGATNITAVGNFGSNPATSPVVNGVPQYSATLANLDEIPVTVLTGLPTVAGGNLGEDSNSVLVDLIFVIKPQYFTPAAASLINLTLIISPLP
jgi:hypothetical protein